MTVDETIEIVRQSAEDLLGHGAVRGEARPLSMIAGCVPSGYWPYVQVIIDPKRIPAFLEANGLGPGWPDFREMLAMTIDERLETTGTVIHGLQIDGDYQIDVYPGGETKENPFLIDST